jgi:hypothetical protein
MTPTSLFSSSTTGMASRLYEATCRATSSWHADQVGRHDPLERCGRRHEEQPPQRDHSDEVPPHVDDVEVEDHLHVPGLLERRDRLGRRHVFRKREDLRIHDAAGGLLRVLEELADLAAGRALLNQLENGRRQLLRQVIDDGCRIV